MNILVAGQSVSGSNLLRKIIKYIFKNQLETAKQCHITKIHLYNEQIHEQSDIIFTSKRDLRDSMASGCVSMSIPTNSNHGKYYINGELTIPKVELAKQIGEGMILEYNDWEKYSNYEFKYERYIEDNLAEIRSIMAFLNIKADKLKVLEDVKSDKGVSMQLVRERNIKIRHDAISTSGGKVGRYKDFFTEREISQLEKHFKNHLTKTGYLK